MGKSQKESLCQNLIIREVIIGTDMIELMMLSQKNVTLTLPDPCNPLKQNSLLIF